MGVSTWKAGKVLSLLDRWSEQKTIKERDEVRCLPKAGDPPLSSPSRACRSMAAFFLSLFSPYHPPCAHIKGGTSYAFSCLVFILLFWLDNTMMTTFPISVSPRS